MTDLGLVMIVKDEARIIGRCLDSVRGHIDWWTICDTGSTDDTSYVVKSMLDGIPGEYLHGPWVDFGTNRTEALKAAHNKARWLLMLDADQTLVSAGPFPDGEAGLVRFDGPTDYAKPLLVSGRRSWRWIGKTHEYLEAGTAGSEIVEAPGWIVHDWADGSSREEKWDRDLELLLPDAYAGNHRAMFYVARTFEEKGDTDAALHWYRRRAAAGGWDEEVFVAMLSAGRLSQSRVELARAAKFRPTRAEPWLYLAQVASGEGKFHEALALAEHGMTIGYPFGDVLFIERWVYEWGLRMERSAAAWHTGDVDRCRRDSLALLGTLPPHAREQVERNLEFCR